MRFILLFLLHLALFAAEFDCAFIGTSPFSLFEALYQSHSGKKVLILESDCLCGGAWKSIDICGVLHADMGCHQIGNDAKLKAFLEEYAGCKMVSLDDPLLPFDSAKSPNGYYFSQGCFELIDHLLQLIRATPIELYTNHKVESVLIDSAQKTATIQTKDRTFTTQKLIVTPMSCLILSPTSQPQSYGKSKHYHLYLLVQDPTPPRFSYHTGLASGVSRLMNLTHFLGMANTGRQLIVVQTHNEQNLQKGQEYLDALKNKDLIDPAAYILQEETYIYESGSFHQGLISQMGAQEVIEVLPTGHIQSLSNHISKWKQALKPYNVALQK